MFGVKDDRHPDRKVSVSTEVSASPEAIFELLADPAQHPLLDGSGTVLATRDAPGRLKLGSRFAMQMRHGVPYRVVNTVVEFDDGRRIAWRHVSGHRWIWELEPLPGDRTRVTETFDWSTAHTPGLIELLGYPQRNERGMLATLERVEDLVVLRGGDAASGATRGATRDDAPREEA